MIWYHKKKPGLQQQLGLLHVDRVLADELISGGFAEPGDSDPLTWPSIERRPAARYARRDMRAEK
jgi:hypothetical protein